MRHQDFRIKAASFFFSPIEGVEIEDQLIALDLHVSEDLFEDCPDTLLIWEPFENHDLEDIQDYIDVLARYFEDVYKKGEFDGYEKIKNLIEKQYQNTK